MVTVVRRDGVLRAHNSHGRSSGHSHGSRSLRHNENTAKKRTNQQQEAGQTSIGLQSSREVTHNGEQLV